MKDIYKNIAALWWLFGLPVFIVCFLERYGDVLDFLEPKSEFGKVLLIFIVMPPFSMGILYFGPKLVKWSDKQKDSTRLLLFVFFVLLSIAIFLI